MRKVRHSRFFLFLQVFGFKPILSPSQPHLEQATAFFLLSLNMARRVPRPQGRPQTKLIAFSPGRRVLADAVPDDGDLNQNDILARQQLELELLASSAATTSPDSRLSSSSSSRSYSSSSSSRILSQSSWSVPVSTEEEIEEDLNEDLSPRGSRITTGRHWRFILTLILSIMIVVAYFTIRNLISRGVSDEILIRFQRPIENGFGWANRRMIYRMHNPIPATGAVPTHANSGPHHKSPV